MIFIDTSAFIAIIFPKDKFHKKAVNFLKNNKGAKFYTSDIVVIESLGWIRYKDGQKLALEASKRFYESGDIDVVKYTQNDMEMAWKYFRNIKGRGVSMVDVLSFAIMDRLNIKKAFTFDSDFKKAGFEILPQ